MSLRVFVLVACVVVACGVDRAQMARGTERGVGVVLYASPDNYIVLGVPSAHERRRVRVGRRYLTINTRSGTALRVMRVADEIPTPPVGMAIYYEFDSVEGRMIFFLPYKLIAAPTPFS